MKETIEKVTNFVNENTILLIGICAFLILVLIVYLIDNSIKTKKMQKALKEMDASEDKVVENNIENKPKDAVVEFDIKNDNSEEDVTFDSISLINEEETDNKESVNTVETSEPKVEEKTVEEPVVEQKTEENTSKEENKFTNKKSLTEILNKKKESINENATDKTLEETTDFNNTF